MHLSNIKNRKCPLCAYMIFMKNINYFLKVTNKQSIAFGFLLRKSF